MNKIEYIAKRLDDKEISKFLLSNFNDFLELSDASYKWWDSLSIELQDEYTPEDTTYDTVVISYLLNSCKIEMNEVDVYQVFNAIRDYEGYEAVTSASAVDPRSFI